MEITSNEFIAILRSGMELPKNMTVGGSLYLRGTGITALPNGIKVADDIISENKEYNNNYKLKDGDYEKGRYIYVDGILTHVRKERKIGEYTIFYGKIKKQECCYRW